MNNLVTKTVDLIYKMDHNDQLNQVIEAINLKRNQLSRKAVAKFMIGDIAGFTGRRGIQHSGKVTKVAQKYITIDCGTHGRWRVPATHCTKLAIGEEV